MYRASGLLFEFGVRGFGSKLVFKIFLGLIIGQGHLTPAHPQPQSQSPSPNPKVLLRSRCRESGASFDRYAGLSGSGDFACTGQGFRFRVWGLNQDSGFNIRSGLSSFCIPWKKTWSAPAERE